MNKSTPFRFLNLPFVAQKKIIPWLEPADVVQLSLQSTKFRKVICTVKLNTVSLTWKFDAEDCHIFLNFKKGQELVKLRTPLHTLLTRKTKFKRPIQFSELGFKRAQRNEFQTRELVPNQEATFNRTTKMELLEMYTSVLLPMLRVESFRLSSNLSESIDFLNCFVWKFKKNFGHIEFHSPESKNSDRVFKELKFLQEQVTADQMRLKFTPNPNQPSGYVHLKQKSLEIVKAEFISLDSYLNMETCELDLWYPKLSDSDLNAFIKKWLGGGLENLERFSMRAHRDLRLVRQVMKEIEEVNPRRPRPSHIILPDIFVSLNVYYVKDIQRPSDGRFATLVFFRAEFRFFVWPADN